MKKNLNYIAGWDHPEEEFWEYPYTVTDGYLIQWKCLNGDGEVWARSYKTMEEAKKGAQQRYENLKRAAWKKGLTCTDVCGDDARNGDKYVLIRFVYPDYSWEDIYEHLWHEAPRGLKDGKK